MNMAVDQDVRRVYQNACIQSLFNHPQKYVKKGLLIIVLLKLQNNCPAGFRLNPFLFHEATAKISVTIA
jgi:hypothetical protein